MAKHTIPSGMSGSQFEKYVRDFFAPELQAANLRVTFPAPFSKLDQLGVDMQVWAPDGKLVANTQLKIRLDCLRDRPLHRMADSLLTIETLQQWALGNLDAVAIVDLSKQFVATLRKVHSPMIDSY